MAKVVSIQGERQEEEALTLWATDGEVDDFVREADDKYLLCRDRARHGYRTVKQAVADGLEFCGETHDGFLERRELCPDCEAVERVEVWDVGHNPRSGRVTRCKLVRAYTYYVDEAYQNKTGAGRMKPRQIRESIASQALGTRSYRKLVADAKKRQAERREAARKAQLELVAHSA